MEEYPLVPTAPEFLPVEIKLINNYVDLLDAEIDGTLLPKEKKRLNCYIEYYAAMDPARRRRLYQYL